MNRLHRIPTLSEDTLLDLIADHWSCGLDSYDIAKAINAEHHTLYPEAAIANRLPAVLLRIREATQC